MALPPRSALCAVLLILITVQQSAGYPSRWAAKIADEGLNCLAHPTGRQGGHAAPKPNKAIGFALATSTGAATQTVCPSYAGVRYTLTETLPQFAHAFVTVSAGSSLAPGVKPAGCPGVRFEAADAARSFRQTLTLRCSDVTAKGRINVKLTYATGVGGGYNINSASFRVNEKCYANACKPLVKNCTAFPASASGVRWPTNCGGKTSCSGACRAGFTGGPVSAVCVTPGRTWTVVSGQCTRATPSPSPSPRPSPSPSLSPSPSPVPSPQVGPPCNVLGCTRCNESNPEVCVAADASKGYALNTATGKADCLPGWAGFAGVGCVKCQAGFISYGGAIPNLGCIRCTAGTVPSAEQSECVVAATAWEHWGGDLNNRRWGSSETTISPDNAGSLTAKWTYDTAGDVSATPTVVGGRLYVPDWNGLLHCVDAATGTAIWKRPIINYILSFDPAPYPADFSNSSIISRTSPAVVGDTLVIGTMKKGGGFPYLLAISTVDGSLKWGKRVDPHPAAGVTQSPTLYNGHVYVGISSLEEVQADIPGYDCCTFRGSFIKVDLSNGNELWRTYMTPDNFNKSGGFSGAAVWGSSPAIDVSRNSVYIATGNNYDVPEPFAACVRAANNISSDAEKSTALRTCSKELAQGNHIDSIISLDLDTGAIKWAEPLEAADAWNVACLTGNNKESCPNIDSPDYDFAQAPMLVNACKSGSCKQLVVAGQKSGWLWALQPDIGRVEWGLPVGPGGVVGGMQWGSASDNSRIYVSNHNSLFQDIDLTKMNSVPNTPGGAAPTKTNGGIAAAVDAYTGEIVWTFASPLKHWADDALTEGFRSARSMAPMSVANGVVYYCNMDKRGTLFFLEASTGRPLGSYETGVTCGSGPSIVDGRVFVGDGYLNFGLGELSRSGQLQALGLP